VKGATLTVEDKTSSCLLRLETLLRKVVVGQLVAFFDEKKRKERGMSG